MDFFQALFADDADSAESHTPHSYDEVISESDDLLRKFTRMREDAIIERKALIRTGADSSAVAEIDDRIRSYERVIDTAGSVKNNMSGMKRCSAAESGRSRRPAARPAAAGKFFGALFGSGGKK